MKEAPNCYKCKFRRDLPGNAHSRCAHPSIPEMGPLAEIASIFGGGRPMPNEINVKGNQHGIRMGWFMWPLNFDPTWLESCDGFTALDRIEVQKDTRRRT